MSEEILMFLIGILVSVVVQGVRILASSTGWKPNKEMIAVIALVISLVVGVLANLSQLSGLFSGAGDPNVILGAVVQALGIVYGSATAWYNLILSNLFDKLGLDADKFFQPKLE